MEQKDKSVGLKSIQTEQKSNIVHKFQPPRPLKAGDIGSIFSRNGSPARGEIWVANNAPYVSPSPVGTQCGYLYGDNTHIASLKGLRKLPESSFATHIASLKGLVCFIFLLLLSACATREEGCNDALANNFDLGADKPCDGCCEYPGVRIRLTHKYGSAAMVYNQAIFTDGSGNTFGFGDLRFYLSNIQVLSIGNKVIDVQEPLDVYQEKSAGDTLKTSIPNSFGLARGLGQADMYIQSYRDTATINRIRFTIGVSGEMNQANPLRLPSDHPMRNSVYDGTYLGAQNGYVFARALYYAKDTVDVKISGSANLRTVEVSFTPAKIQRGYNLNVLMDVNYARWFQNVNVNSDTPAQISQKIVQNLAQSFTVTAVSTGL